MIKYPVTYTDRFSKEQLQSMEKWLNHEQYLINHIDEVDSQSHDRDVKVYAFKARMQHNARINAIVEFLECIDIYVGYNWVNHENKYFFITEEDAIKQAEKLALQNGD